MNDAQKPYDQLIGTLKEITTLGSIGSVLGWDEETHMPPKGAGLRAEQSAVIARLTHERFTDPRIGELLSEIEGSGLMGEPHAEVATNVRETRRHYDRQRKLPTSLVEEMTRTRVLAHEAWIGARERSEYPAYAPWLEKTLDLKRQEAACVGYTGHIYNALLDEYEPGETAEGLREVFGELRQPLVDLVGRIAGCGKQAPIDILQREYPAAGQAKLARDAAEAIGFDFSAGRLDVSVHPFCSGIGPGDCRLTTRYDEHWFGDAFFGVLHETGHGLYDQGLPKEHWGTPCGDAISLGIHESQSRMWENLVGRSRAFWRHFMPKARAVFRRTMKGVNIDQWVWAVNDVRPSLIRTEADEVTYNLHVLLRFEIEQAMLMGDLKVADIPTVWNEKMKQYLGIVPPGDREGCLQDVHWSHGSIGYFPTYTLGNLYAAQFFEAAGREVGDLDAMFARGEFAPLLAWLRQKIHSQGQRYRARELVKNVTGEDLSAAPLLKRLEAKARENYGV